MTVIKKTLQLGGSLRGTQKKLAIAKDINRMSDMMKEEEEVYNMSYASEVRPGEPTKHTV